MPHFLRDCPTFYQQNMPVGRREEGAGFVIQKQRVKLVA